MLQCSNTQEFIIKAKKVYGNKYDYSKTKYTNQDTKVTICCLEHGEFKQTPKQHLLGKEGCPKCTIRNKSLTTNQFIERARKAHGDKYDYSKTEYKNSSTKVNIICLKHGEFFQSPIHHIAGMGCPKCANEKKGDYCKLTTDQFIERAKKIHGDKYDYSQVYYQNHATKVKIICPKHGAFMQQPFNHIAGMGCPDCGNEKMGRKIFTTEDFIKKAREVHGDKYNYHLANYFSASHKVKIVCPLHGSFMQNPGDHIRGEGCPKCGHMISKLEDQLYEYLKDSYDGEVIQRNRKILEGGKELDIYCPDAKIAIEVNGNYWHGEGAYYTSSSNKNLDYYRYHQLRKYQECKNKGIYLINLYEDEVKNKFDIVTELIMTKLGIYDTVEIEKCKVFRISQDDADYFYERHHIEGSIKNDLHYGLFNQDDEIIEAMSIKKIKGSVQKWKIVRFTSLIKTGLGLRKLLDHFIKHHSVCNRIVVYSDNRFSNDDLLYKLHFENEKNIKPSFWYIKRSGRNPLRQPKEKFSKENQSKIWKDFNSELSEKENASNHKYYRIWDAGKEKWTMNL